MKKTTFILADGNSFKRVWVDKNGDYFIKFEGTIVNVNKRVNDFIKL